MSLFSIPTYPSNHNPRRRKWPSEEARFWSKAEKPSINQCWNWIACVGSGGYGSFLADGRAQKAHRIAYKMAFGEFPRELDVCHTCDNPKCVNPNHLWLGTARDNILDCMKKRRNRAFNGEMIGFCNNNAKLTFEQVQEIRNKYATRQFTYSRLSSIYGVSAAHLGEIVRGKERRDR